MTRAQSRTGTWEGIDMVENPDAEPTGSRTRPWSIKAMGLLLLLQAVGMSCMGLFYVDVSDLADRLIEMSESSTWAMLRHVTGDAIAGILLVQLSFLALLAAFGFWRMRRNAWMNALLLQGLSLALALIRYFTGAKSWGMYILMLYAVLMVLYLNYYEVRMALRPAAPQHLADGGSGGER